MNTRPDTIANIASYFGIDAQKQSRQYKHEVSGYHQWDQLKHAEDYILFPENITSNLSIDEVSLSKGELYTIVTNKNTGVKNKKTVVAIINGTEAKTIHAVLSKIPTTLRNQVKEVSMDMARNMGLAIENSFPNCKKVIDRFHVVRLVMDALQHIRVKRRWKAIDEENILIRQAKAKGEKYYPTILSNGDTVKELLVRSKYLLYKPKGEWTANQSKRAQLLFEHFPILKDVYHLTISFPNIYKIELRTDAQIAFHEWIKSIRQIGIDEFNTVVNSLEYNMENILNFFENRSTNGKAESFNSKIKGFRANLRGVTDIPFFLFRLSKLFA